MLFYMSCQKTRKFMFFFYMSYQKTNKFIWCLIPYCETEGAKIAPMYKKP